MSDPRDEPLSGTTRTSAPQRPSHLRTVPAEIRYIGSHTQLVGHPGALTQYNEGPALVSADVCCPGCGEVVYHLGGREYPIAAAIYPWPLTCARPVVFTQCCGSAWELRDSVWRELSSV